ncbi:MAG: ABC transporter permease [Candidatus Improbicoccus pseudotrichonymphae]|uniref:ABC transporter permease n=1 Tax=Candidatus Improbicoccus pseudotrichonymphae TaxID=3033792 RepID=A0AA48IH61_9FIRM|nr:MAG: ABC transporter permease [Candidatus Improbicoccus pseudotrichonymphae]
MDILFSICSQGLIWSVLAVGLFITFRVLNFPDMTAEGSLTLGGVITSVFICLNFHPMVGLFFAMIFGAMAGLITGFLHTKLKIPPIIAGILTMISLYSINIRIMGKANISLLGKSNIFSIFKNSFFESANSDVTIFVISLVFCFVLVFLINLFFKTQIGLAVRATGDNEYMMRAQGANTDFKKILALMISNGVCAISGSFISQSQGYADVNMGVGSIVIALASIVLGETIVNKNVASFNLRLISIIVGSILYRMIIFIVLSLGMNPSDLKLITAIIATAFLAWPNFKNMKKKWCKNC